MTAGVPAEFGRFTGGVVNAVSKSGGNDLTGTLRDTLTNSSWASLTKYGREHPGSETLADKVNNTYEGTVGGPVLPDRIWFFGVAFLTPGASAGWTLAWLVPALFFLAVPIGSAYASLQLIFPNQVRGQVSALLLVIFNLIGLTLGPLLPGALNDYVFNDGRMVGTSIGITSIVGCVVMMATFRSIYAPYRRHHALMQSIEEPARV